MDGWKYDSGYWPLAKLLPFEDSEVGVAVKKPAQTELKGPQKHHLHLWLQGRENGGRLLIIADWTPSKLNVFDVLPIKEQWPVDDPIAALRAVVAHCGVEVGYGDEWAQVFAGREFEDGTHSVGFRSSRGGSLEKTDVALRERSFGADTGGKLILLAYGYNLQDLEELFQ